MEAREFLELKLSQKLLANDLVYASHTIKAMEEYAALKVKETKGEECECEPKDWYVNRCCLGCGKPNMWAKECNPTK